MFSADKIHIAPYPQKVSLLSSNTLCPEPVAIVDHPCGVNIKFILNTSPDSPPTNLLVDESTKHTGFTHIALEITDVDTVKNQLDGHGIVITEQVEFEGAIFFFVRDPDGNVIEFHKPAK